MPSLLDCPPEILCSIFRHLNRRYNRGDLRFLCLTHRTLRPIAEKLLYSRLDWVWHSPTSTPPIASFLASLHRRPELAAFVQTIVIFGSNHEHNFPSPRIMGGDSCGPIEDAVQQVERLQFPNAVNWVHGLLNGHMDALVAHLLFTVRGSLRELIMDVNLTQNSFLIANMFQHVLCSYDRFKLGPAFPNLQHVNVIHPFPKVHQFHNRRDNTREVLPFLYLPSVRTLSLVTDNEINAGNSYWPVLKHTPPDPSNLKSLHLRLVREGRLGQILTKTNPQTLKWQWYYRSDLDDGKYMTSTIDLDQLSKDLSHIRQSLTHLTITATTSKGPTSEPPLSEKPPDHPPLTYPSLTIKGNPNQTLTPLFRLKTLQIPLPFLLGFSGAIATNNIFTITPPPPPPPKASKSPLSYILSKLSNPPPKNPNPNRNSNHRRLGPALPPSLEHLTLTDDLSHQPESQWRLTELQEILIDWILGSPGWREFTPNLKGVHVHFRGKKRGVVNEEIFARNLEGLGRKGGVGITFVRGVWIDGPGCGCFWERGVPDG